MYLSTNLAIFKTGSFFFRLKKIHDMGFEAVGISFTAQGPYRLWVGNLTDSQIEEVKQALSPFQQVNIHAGFLQLSLLSHHPGIRKITMEEYLANLEVAGKLGIGVVDFHPGAEWENLTDEEVNSLMAESMITIDKKAQESGVLACWETGAGYFVPLERFDNIRKLGLKNTGICMDTGHLVRVWKELDPNGKIRTFSEFIKRYGDLIHTTHIHDWQDDPKGKYTWNDHHMVGNGKIDWGEVFSSLVIAKYDGTLLLEYHPDSFANEEDMLKNCDYVRKLVRETGGKII